MISKRPKAYPVTAESVTPQHEYAVEQVAAPYVVTPKLAPDIFASSYEAAPRERIAEIRRGIPARRIGELSVAMDLPKDKLMDFLGLSRATVNRKAQSNQALARDESERVVGVQVLVGQVQALVEESGVGGFDAARWVARWLGEPLPALGGDRPADYLDTIEGQKLVGQLLAMAGSGAYA